MKKLIIIFLLLYAAPCLAVGGWMDQIRQNQQIAIDYMYALNDAPSTPRPSFYPPSNWKAKRSMEEIEKAMARAEKQAAAGRQVQIPVFRFGPDDTGW